MSEAKTYRMTERLSEASLEDLIKFVFDVEPRAQYGVFVPGEGNCRVDYAFLMPNEQQVFVEFNGPTHYTNTSTILRDYALRSLCEDQNIRLVEIPYFVQMNDYSIEEYFGVAVLPMLEGKTVVSALSSGFNDRPIVLPYDYCQLGVSRLMSDLNPNSKVRNGDPEDLGADCWGTLREIWESLQHCRLSQKEARNMKEFLSSRKGYQRDLGQVLSNFPT